MAFVHSTTVPLLKLTAALAKAAGLSFSVSAGIIGVLAVAGKRSHKRAKVSGRPSERTELAESEEQESEVSESESETSCACEDNDAGHGHVVTHASTPSCTSAPQQACVPRPRPKVHASSWAKLQRAFLFSSMKTQWRQRSLLREASLTGHVPELHGSWRQRSLLRQGAPTGRSPKHHGHQRQSAQKAKEAQGVSPAALRFQKLVKGLRSSFGFSGLPAAKSRRQLLANSKKGMLRTASSIQSREYYMTASSHAAMRPARGSIAAFYLPSRHSSPRQRQGHS